MARGIRFSEDIEPLVHFIEETPPEKIVEETTAKLLEGAPEEQMMTALTLAVKFVPALVNTEPAALVAAGLLVAVTCNANGRTTNWLLAPSIHSPDGENLRRTWSCSWPTSG